MAAVLANGGGFYHPFAYIAEAMRMGLTILPPDVNASEFRTTGRDREVRIGFQFIKGLSADAVERVLEARVCHPERSEGSVQVVPFTSFADFRARTGLRAEDLRLLVKVGALDSIAGGMTRPMLLWAIDAESGAPPVIPRERSDRGISSGAHLEGSLAARPSGLGEHMSATRPRGSPLGLGMTAAGGPPRLREYSVDRRRRAEYELLSFTTDSHPMELYREELTRFRVVPTTELHKHVGRTVLAAGMLTTAKPVHTIKDEPMEFATFDDGHGLIEAVLFPRIYHERGHVLFDQGPFIFRGKVEEEFGAITLTITHLDRLARMLEKVRAPARRLAAPNHEG
jgi:DNA polymerase III alpha subunit